MRRLLAQSRRPSPTLPFPKALRRLFPFGRAHRTLVRDYDIISHSPLFDPDWYIDKYRNVSENGEDPIHHFLKFGCEYALSPGPHFDTNAYFDENPRVRERGENPLLHLIRTSAGATPKPRVLDRLKRSWTRRPPPAEEGDADPYAAWVNQYEGACDWATGQSGPKISFLVVARNGATAALSDTLSSLDALRGREWEAIVASGHVSPDAALSSRVAQVAIGADKRGALLTDLLAAATGGFFAVLDAGDRVSPHALQEIWRCLAERPELDLVYSDEDLSGPGGRERPVMKPGWSPEYFDSFDYFGRLTCIRASVALRAGSFSDNYEGGAEYDLNLRVCEATQNIGRIPKILCHRSHDLAGARAALDSAGLADHRRALVARWGRRGIVANVTPQPNGALRSSWPLIDPPLVSLVIPTRNERNRLEATIDRLLRRTDYPNIEIVAVGDRVADMAHPPKSDARAGIRFVTFTAPFNHAAACNLGARAAAGSMLLFLGDDVEALSPDWLDELVRCVDRIGVGIAGPILASPGGEQAGIAVGMGDGFGAIGPVGDSTVFGPPSALRNCLGLGHACLMVRRHVFDLVGGFDETYRSADSGIGLSLAAWRAGYRTVCTPFVRLVPAADAPDADPRPAEDQARLMRDLDAFGILEDPYVHPTLSASHPSPTLCSRPNQAIASNLAEKRTEHLAAYGEPSNLDLFDTADVILALGRDEAGEAFWEPQHPSAIHNVRSAMRFVIDLIRREPGLRARFPRALSDGNDGPFARWLVSGQGRTRFDLSQPATEAIEAAFASVPADAVRRAYLFQDDIRTRTPLGCTPAGRRELFLWLMRTGRHEHELRIEAIWWFMLECAERPAQELVWTYLFSSNWQRLFPDGLTVFGRQELVRWLKVMYRAAGDWLDPAHWPVSLSPAEQIRLAYHRREAWQRLHPKAFASEAEALALLEWLASGDADIPGDAHDWLRMLDKRTVAANLPRTGTNILGHFCYPSGLRTSTESIVKGLHQAGCDTSLRDVWVEAQKDDPHHVRFNGLETFDTTIIHVQPEPLFSQAYDHGGLFARLPRTYRIAFWYWELDEIPARWLEKADEIDEIWVATRFVGDAMRARFDKPVHEFLPGLELSPFDPLPRSHFGLADGRFTFLFVFHMVSITERKNPIGLIRAFRAAFGDRPDPLLVLKTSFGDQHPESFRAMRDAAAGEGIEIIDAIYSPDETLSIMNACDCYVSLHRSEGYGLTMAEAMLLGKPVIATAYSGNLDFMDVHNSLLVEHEMVTLETDCPPYPAGSRWAEPSIEHAAACMRRVYEDQAWARELGARAKADLATRLSYAASGARMAQRLAEIDRTRR